MKQLTGMAVSFVLSFLWQLYQQDTVGQAMEVGHISIYLPLHESGLHLPSSANS